MFGKLKARREERRWIAEFNAATGGYVPAGRAAQRGAALLDRYGPDDWADRVNLDTLDIATSNNCVIGQVYGHFSYGYDEFKDDLPPGIERCALSFSLGFMSRQSEPEWRRLIGERQTRAYAVCDSDLAVAGD